MNRIRSLFFALLLTCPLTTLAQHADAAAAAPTSAVPDAAKQFDFLLGQWQVEVHPKISSLVAMIHGTPKIVGTWKAWRAADGLGIEDEMRIVDGSGNPLSLSRAHRSYAQAEARWKISALDTLRASASESTGHWLDGEMRLEGHYTDDAGKPILTRTRYYNIGADSFRMQQDRSSDNGQSWDEGALSIDAKRSADTATP